MTAEQAISGALAGTISTLLLNEYDPRSGLFIARDFNPDPNIVEVVLFANESRERLLPDVRTEMWTYNGVYPGPQIIGDVGDTVIAHVINALPMETTIHWHGVEIAAAMDGSFITQLPIQPNSYFRYEFEMRNPALYWFHPHIRTDKQIELGLQAPLIMRDPGDNELLGIEPRNDRTFVLDDILLVTDQSDPDYGQAYDFALDDDFLEDHSAAERAELIFNGRDTADNLLMVNGKGTFDAQENPEELYTVHVKKGVPERWRFVNTADGRFMRISIRDKVLHQIATDGGLLEEPIAKQPINLIPNPENPDELISNPDPDLGILLSVAERAEIVFVADGEPGDVMYLEWHDFPRGRHRVVSPGEMLSDGTVCMGDAPCFEDHPEDGERAPRRLMRIVVEEPEETPPPYELPQTLRDLEDIRDDVNLDDLDQALPISFGHAPPNEQGLVTFFAAVADSRELHEDARAATGPVPPPNYGPRPLARVLENPEELALWAEIGDTRYWEAVNFTGNGHPLHTHGFFFQAIHTQFVDLETPENNRIVEYPLALEDTIRLPKRTGGMGTSWTITRLAVRLSDDHLPPALQRTPEELIAYGGDPTVRPGGWLDHCHIDQHAQSGMMTLLNTVPVGFPIPSF